MKLLFDSTVKQFDEKVVNERMHTQHSYEKIVNEQGKSIQSYQKKFSDMVLSKFSKMENFTNELALE